MSELLGLLAGFDVGSFNIFTFIEPRWAPRVLWSQYYSAGVMADLTGIICWRITVTERNAEYMPIAKSKCGTVLWSTESRFLIWMQTQECSTVTQDAHLFLWSTIVSRGTMWWFYDSEDMFWSDCTSCSVLRYSKVPTNLSVQFKRQVVRYDKVSLIGFLNPLMFYWKISSKGATRIMEKCLVCGTFTRNV